MIVNELNAKRKIKILKSLKDYFLLFSCYKTVTAQTSISILKISHAVLRQNQNNNKEEKFLFIFVNSRLSIKDYLNTNSILKKQFFKFPSLKHSIKLLPNTQYE